MQIVIKKAAIKGSLFLSYEFEQTDVDVKNLIKTSSDAPIHDDLRQCFRKLIPHFCFISEEITKPETIKAAIDDPDTYLMDEEVSPNPTFFKYRVFQFSVVEKDGDEVVYLHGSKRLETTKEITFSTPGISMVDSEYKFGAELLRAVDQLKSEVLQYMQGKSAPKSQLEMFGEEQEEETEQDAL